MKLKKIAAGAAVLGALGFASVGIGAGPAQADDDWCWWGWGCEFVPSVPDLVNVPPGQIAHLPGVPPPGHWDKPWKWWN